MKRTKKRYRRNKEKHVCKQAPNLSLYKELKQIIASHYNDGLKLHRQMYPQIFDTEYYMKVYHKMERTLTLQGYDIVQRNYIHMSVRMDLIEEYERFKNRGNNT